MKVTVGGLVWMPLKELSVQQVYNLKNQLTVQPKKTTNLGNQEEPPPIFLFEEREEEGLIGIPRGYYRRAITKKHEEVLDISYGFPMRKEATEFTRWRAEGRFSEQETVLKTFEHLNEGHKWGGHLLEAGCAFGKALAHGEPVLTPSGYVSIEKLSVGDVVAGTDGGFHKVVGVYPQGKRKCYRVTFTDGTHVDCDEDHSWTFERRQSRGKAVTITTEELFQSELSVDSGRIFWLPDTETICFPDGTSIPDTGSDDQKSDEWRRRTDRAVENVYPLAGKRYATCISVDSPDRLFLTRGCVPTHNTATALEYARRKGRRTLILVHQEFFIDQWKKRINYFMPGARVGIIRQNKKQYEDVDFSIGMLQSLARDVDGTKYPKDMYEAFGLVIGDEIHRVGAASWSNIIPKFKAAWRLGLSATPKRLDGAHDVFFNHISEVTYKAESEAAVPKLRVLRTHTELEPIQRGSYHVSTAKLNSAQVLTQLGNDKFRARDVVDQLVLAVKAGRKVMVVSERMAHLKLMSDMLTNSLFDMKLPFEYRIDFYTGEWYCGGKWEKTTKAHKKGSLKTSKRTREELERAESANVIFATKQMVSEGLDIQALDVLVLATPGGNVEQTVGRVRRWCEAEKEKCDRLCPWRTGKCKEKPTPIVMDVVDENIPQLQSKWKRRQAFYRKIGTLGNKQKGIKYGRGDKRQK